jgi:hypothetical protein
MRSLLKKLLGNSILSRAFNTKKAVDIWGLFCGYRGAQAGFLLTPLQAAATSRSKGALQFVQILVSYAIRTEYDSTFCSRGLSYQNAPRNIDISFIREIRQSLTLAVFGGQDRVAAYLLRMLMLVSARPPPSGGARGDQLLQGVALEWQSIDWIHIVDQCASHGLHRTLAVIFFHLCEKTARTSFLEDVGLFDLFHSTIINETYLREKYECACMGGHSKCALEIIRICNANCFTPPAVLGGSMTARSFMEISRGLLNKKPRPSHKKAILRPILDDDDVPIDSTSSPSSPAPPRTHRRRVLLDVPQVAGTRPGVVKILRSRRKASSFRSFGRSILGPSNSISDQNSFDETI